ncbi:MAG TPA: hypothetical protein PLU43_08135 [Lachnospiraceae bacterium]|nr:hypothetical protein [Lachnospiraceae bacterium]
MNRLCTDQEELEKDREFFYTRYLDHYTKEVHIGRHMEFYHAVLKKS